MVSSHPNPGISPGGDEAVPPGKNSLRGNENGEKRDDGASENSGFSLVISC